MAGDTIVVPDPPRGVHVGAVLNDLYLIEAHLASGGMGDVFRARAIDTGDVVAIKTVRQNFVANPTAIELFRKEADALRALHHDAIVRYFVFSSGKSLRQPYVAMEYVAGKSLSEVIREGPASFADVCALLRRLATGLQVAHAQGIVHRDLSPDNIVLPDGRFEQAKIIDFGIARVLAASHTVIGQGFTGKYDYVSPEQMGFFGGHVASRSDIYSLALVIAEVARGRPLIAASNIAQAAEARQRLPQIDDLDPRLRPLLQRMLQPDPKDRLPDLSEVVTWMPGASTSKVKRRSRVALVAMSALIVLIGISIFAADRLRRRTADLSPVSDGSIVKQAIVDKGLDAVGVKPFEGELATRMRAITPSLPTSVIAERVAAYSRAKDFKAQAVSYKPFGTWRTSERDSRDAAADKVLEGCQVYHGQPCALIAVGSALEPLPTDGTDPAPRDMPRVRYDGLFDPERIPASWSLSAQPSDLRAYRSMSVPKAAAYHPWGRVFTATAGASQREAEKSALDACNGDPIRKGADGPCYLYAVGDRVVLPARETNPSTPAAAVRQPALQEVTLAWLAGAIPELAVADREMRARAYTEANGHKALALAPGTRSTWYVKGRASATVAEEKVLEGCQVYVGQPCVLVAVDDQFSSLTANQVLNNDRGKPYTGTSIVPSSQGWNRRDMPRARYNGRFDPEQVPALPDSQRRRPDILGYGSITSPKSAAYHPWGRLFLAAGATSQGEAERRALADCNADPERGGRDGPCYVYALGNQVVLPDRRSQALAP